MLRSLTAFAIALVATLALTSSAFAAEAEFTKLYEFDGRGEIATAGNALAHCVIGFGAPYDGNCTTARTGSGPMDNGSVVMAPINLAGGTHNSSSADITMPATATVRRAYLYWGGSYQAGTVDIDLNANFRVPGGSYVPVTGQLLGSSAGLYGVRADVTDLVAAAGAGTYSVAEVDTFTNFLGTAAGWNLVVVYEDSSEEVRAISLFDGYKTNGGAGSTDFTISGFFVPPTGTPSGRLSLFTMEGDDGIFGDQLSIGGSAFSDAVNPATNFFNSSISRLGAHVSGGKSPDYVNQLGIDADTYDVSSRLSNSQTSMDLSMTSTGDVYDAMFAGFSVDILQPVINGDKSVTDVNGGSIQPGDILEYEIDLTNTGNDVAEHVLFSDVVPTGTTYVEGSLEIVSGPNAGALTTASGDDQGEVAGGIVTVRVGTGADESVAGDLAIAQSSVVRFQVQVDADVAIGTTIQNAASTNYVGQTSGQNKSVPTNNTEITIDFDLDVEKTASLLVDADSSSSITPGDTLRYTVDLTNHSTFAAQGVDYDVTPDANTSLVVGSVTTTQGSVTTGNTGGDSSVSVALGNIAVAGTPQITYDVVITDPLAAGVSEVADQGTASGTNFADVVSDDPGTATAADETATAVVADPGLESTLVVTHLNGNPYNPGTDTVGPGDTLTYTLTVSATGNQVATGVAATVAAPAATTLVVGSVASGTGTVTVGNTGGDTSAGVDLASVTPGSDESFTFDVTIDSLLPADTDDVVAQGSVDADHLTVAILTDGDLVTGGTQSTNTPVDANPSLATSLLATHLNGSPYNPGTDTVVPGDVLTYTATITNSGDEGAGSLNLDVPVPSGGTLVANTVGSPSGSTENSGNLITDTNVDVDLPDLAAGGASHSVTFEVTVDDPLAAGITTLTTQGDLSASHLGTPDKTDGDTVTAGEQETSVPVTADPALASTLVISHLNGSPYNGTDTIAPGDTLTYTATITNSGNQAASGLGIAVPVPANTTLVANTVTSPSGSTENSGNLITDTNVDVDLPNLAGSGASHAVTFDVTIDSPLPVGAETLSTQGTVSSTELADVSTDGDSGTAGEQSTDYPVTADPALASTLVISHLNGSPYNGTDTIAPGDTLTYTATITNSGNQAASGLGIAVPVPANTTLVANTVTSPSGSTENSGNLITDTNVDVDLPNLAGSGASHAVTFDVTIDSPLPVGAETLSTQGTVSSTELADVSTDGDSGTAGEQSTDYPVTADPALASTLVISHLNGSPYNGTDTIAPGDTLTYTATITNSGNQAASGLGIAVPVPANTTLVANTVTSPSGSTENSGNLITDTNVDVDLPNLAGSGASHAVTFDVTIDSPLPVGAETLSTQGTVSSTELADVSTDGDSGTAGEQSTDYPVTADPALASTLVISHLNGSPYNGTDTIAPGDTLTYTATITNSGNQAASGLGIAVPVPANTTLVANTVTSPSGSTENSGNLITDTNVDVDLPNLAGSGASHAVTFDVTIDSPLPVGAETLSTQGTVSSTELADVSTDGDSGTAGEQSTDYPVTADPALASTLVISHLNGSPYNGTDTIAPGDTLTYTATITNSGNQAASGLGIAVPVPANTTLVANTVTSPSGSTENSGNLITDTNVDVDLPNLAGSGASHAVTFDVTIDSPLPVGAETLSTQGTVSSTELADVSTDGDSGTAGEQSTDYPVTADPALASTLVISHLNGSPYNGTDTIAPGDTLTYTATITNSGNQAASGLGIAVPVPANTTLVANTVTSPSGSTENSGNLITDTNVDVDLPNLAGSGASHAVTFDVTIDSPLPVGAETLSTQGTVSSTELADVSTDGDSGTAGEQSTDYPVTADPALASTLVISHLNGSPYNGTDTIAPGDTLTYTATITNSGNQAASGLGIAVPVPANTTLVANTVTSPSGSTENSGNLITDTNVDVDLPNLAGSGASHAVTFDVTIDSPLPVGAETLSTQGTVSSTELADVSTDGDSGTAGEQSTDYPVTADPALASTLVISHLNGSPYNGTDTIAPGDTLTYTATITNSGNQAASGLGIAVPVPANTTLVANTVTSPSGSTENSGNLITDTNVDVDLPNLAGSGASHAVTFDVTIDSPLPVGAETLSTQGTVSSTELADVSTDGDSGTAGEQSTDYPVTADPALASTLVISHLNGSPYNGTDTIAPGDTLTYTATITNSGNQAASGLGIAVPVPANTTLVANTVTSPSGSTENSGNLITDTNVDVDLPNLAGSGASHAVTFDVTIDSPLPVGAETLSTQGTVSSTELADVSTDGDSGTAGEQSTDYPVTADPALASTLVTVMVNDADSSGDLSPGDTVKHTITVTNSGNQAVSGVTVNDVPGANTTLVAGTATSSQGTVSDGNTSGDTSVSATLGTIAGGGGTATLEYEATLWQVFPFGVNEITNDALVVSNELADVATNLTTLPVVAAPNVTISVVAKLVVDSNGDGIVTPGDTVRYTVTAENSGNQASGSVGIAGTPDPNTDLVSGSVTTTQGGINRGNASGDTSIAVDFGGLAGGGATATATYDVTVKLLVSPPTASSITSRVTGTVDGNVVATDDPATPLVGDPTVTTIDASVNLDVTTGVSPTSVRIGDKVVFTTKVTNKSPGTASNVLVSIPLPGAMRVDSMTAEVASLATSNMTSSCQGRRTVQCLIPLLKSNETATIRFSSTALRAGSLSYRAQIWADQEETTNEDNVALSPVTVRQGRTKLRITQNMRKRVRAGKVVATKIKVRNVGVSSAKKVVVIDTLPRSMSLVSRRATITRRVVRKVKVRKKVNGKTVVRTVRRPKLVRRTVPVAVVRGKVTVKVGTIAKGDHRIVTLKLRPSRSAKGVRTNPAIARSSNAKTVRSTARLRIAPSTSVVLPAVTG